MQAQEKLEKYVEYRLQEWARWFSSGRFCGLGFPSRSIEYRLMTEAVIEKCRGKRPLSCNEEAEEMEKFVKEMSEQNQKMALALRCYYFHGGGLRKKAKLLKISHTQLKYYVDMGIQWLMGRLSVKNSFRKK